MVALLQGRRSDHCSVRGRPLVKSCYRLQRQHHGCHKGTLSAGGGGAKDVVAGAHCPGKGVEGRATPGGGSRGRAAAARRQLLLVVVRFRGSLFRSSTGTRRHVQQLQQQQVVSRPTSRQHSPSVSRLARGLSTRRTFFSFLRRLGIHLSPLARWRQEGQSASDSAGGLPLRASSRQHNRQYRRRNGGGGIFVCFGAVVVGVRLLV